MGISKNYKSSLPCPPWSPQDCAWRLLKDCLFPSFSPLAMVSSPIRTIPQDSKYRYFWASLACTGRENTLLLSCPAPLSLSKPEVLSHLPHRHGGRCSLGPQGSYCLECAPPSCSFCSFPSLPPSLSFITLWLLLCSAFIYRLPECRVSSTSWHLFPVS